MRKVASVPRAASQELIALDKLLACRCRGGKLMPDIEMGGVVIERLAYRLLRYGSEFAFGGAMIHEPDNTFRSGYYHEQDGRDTSRPGDSV